MSAKSVSLALVWPILALPALVSGMIGYHTTGLRYNSTHSFCGENCRVENVLYIETGEACLMPDAYYKESRYASFAYCKGGKTEPPPGSVNIAGSKTRFDEPCALLPDDVIRTEEVNGKLVPSCNAYKAAVNTAKNPAFETHQEVVAELNALRPQTKVPTEVCDGPGGSQPA